MEQYLTAYPFQTTRFGDRPLDTGWIANCLARRRGHPHSAGRCSASDSARQIDRAAVPVASTVDGGTERKSDPHSWGIIRGLRIKPLHNRDQQLELVLARPHFRIVDGPDRI